MRSAKHGFALSAILIYFALAYFSSLGLPKIAMAADPPATTGAATNVATKSQDSIRDLLCAPSEGGGAGDDLFRCINKLYRVALVVGSIGAVLMIVIAGYLYMSGGSEQISTAKSMMGTSVWGIIILIASYVLLKAINPALVEFKQIAPTNLNDPGGPRKAADVNKEFCAKNPSMCGQDGNITPQAGGSSAGTIPCPGKLVTLKASGLRYRSKVANEQVCDSLVSRLSAAAPSVAWYVTAAIEPGHIDQCHKTTGTCVDVSGSAPNSLSDEQWRTLCRAFRAIGKVGVLNEVSNEVADACGTFVSPASRTGKNLHVEIY